MEILRFEPLGSSFEVSFWSQAIDMKLNKLRLSEDFVGVVGTVSPSQHEGLSARVVLEQGSLVDDDDGPGCSSPPAQAPLADRPAAHLAPGRMVIYNTNGDFLAADRVAMTKQVASSLWQAVESRSALQDPSLLLQFLVTAFVDPKRYVCKSWCLLPALKPPTPFKSEPLLSAAAALGDLAPAAVAACEEHLSRPDLPFAWVLSPHSDAALSARPLHKALPTLLDDSNAILAFSDPCSQPHAAGWPLRNLLLLLAWELREAGQGSRTVSVLCVRMLRGRVSAEASRLARVRVDPLPAEWPVGGVEDGLACVGWEAGPKGKPGPRAVDLRDQMDPLAMAENAVDLNLRLMRWRAAPGIDLESIKSMRALLIGAGTLGCAVSRVLLGWGVRHVTFVDNARVSMSNPVRQSLFAYEDALGEGKPKAEAAADALRRIFPAVTTRGVQIDVPMPGHPMHASEEAAGRAAFETLMDLVRDHDVVFLLTDSRESRWLPTALGALCGKRVVTAALGFDTFVVMRHGQPGAQPDRPGCYFCNDVVAPGDSVSQRTLDQQCTVSRPGLASVAGALAAELAAAWVAGDAAPRAERAEAAGASGRPGEDPAGAREEGSSLGPMPHMVRGCLFGFTQGTMSGRAFSQCVACSDPVLDALREEGWAFVSRVAGDGAALERLTGLDELRRRCEAMELAEDAEGGEDVGESAEEDWEEL